ncbi:hypothetical protein OG410_32915 [Streptomyces sp. NBC_00659]|uniref:hypothetical protein n=1 Tax=Streptomyces sp. NBC_00659 TaxID=2903669 RepID=UPI002E304199|nr:hypothetical protein [Streptomyces sp. NBC_00659]
MKKKLFAVAGITMGGVAAVLSMQGTAQAAAPQADSAPAVVRPGVERAPAGLGSLLGKVAGKAVVHGRAACPHVAKAAGQVANDFFGTHVAPAKGVDGVEAVDTVFDK